MHQIADALHVEDDEILAVVVDDALKLADHAVCYHEWRHRGRQGSNSQAKRYVRVEFQTGIAVVTKAKDLRTGRSVWEQQRAPPLPHKPLTRDLETDVLVIGAGITGAMVADALREAVRVVVVDRRGPAKGSSTASTALVQYEIDTPLIMLARKIGKRDAQRAWRRSRLAVDASRRGCASLRCRTSPPQLALSRRRMLDATD